MNGCISGRSRAFGAQHRRKHVVVWMSAAFLVLAWARPVAAADDVGEITEFAVPFGGAELVDITPGPDGNLWFTEIDTARVGRVTPSGVMTEFVMPNSPIPEGITAGADGNLWFGEQGGAVWKLTTAGVPTRYHLPGGGEVIPVAQGPDGNIWFTAAQGDDPDDIGKITPGGTVTEYPLGTSGGFYDGIAGGPDGNVWFTDFNGSAIGRITPAGVITRFPLGPSRGPEGITLGPDGNLWFTELSKNRIGRITTAGVVTEFTLPHTNSGPQEITAAADGNLWFTEGANRVGQITPTGTITEFTVPTSNSGPKGIAPGPDANVWFVEAFASNVARVIDAPAPALVLTPNSGPPGTDVRVKGTGFGAFERIKLVFIDSVSGKTGLGTVTVSVNGGFSKCVRVPANATPGDQNIGARGAISGVQGLEVFTVT